LPRIAEIMRRHDLHAVLVEDILHVRMERGQNHRARARLARRRLADKTVFDVEIGECRLEHLRLRIREHAVGSLRGFKPHRVYMRMRPLAACPTMPEAPTEIMRPISTERPLNASLSDPGMYGYAITSANTQTAIDTSRRVGRAESASSQPTWICPDCTRSKNLRRMPASPRASRKIATTMKRPGIADAVAESASVTVSTRNVFSSSPQTRVYGNWLRTKPIHS